MIFSKIFFGIWFARKNYEMRKSEFWKMWPEFGNVRSPLPDSSRIIGRNLVRQWLDFGAGRIPATDNC
jgi:hypothetical protein